MTLSDIQLLRRRIADLERSSDGKKECFRDRLNTMRQRLEQLERAQEAHARTQEQTWSQAT